MGCATASIGTTISVSVAEPATRDQAGYAALTFTKVGSTLTIPQFGGTSTATTSNSPIKGLQQNMVGDVNYDPVDEMFYISTLLGLDRVNPYTHNVEPLIQGAGGSGGDVSGELLETARLFYHNREVYDIVGSSWGFVPDIDFVEYHYVKDIEASSNETVLY